MKIIINRYNSDVAILRYRYQPITHQIYIERDPIVWSTWWELVRPHRVNIEIVHRLRRDGLYKRT